MAHLESPLWWNLAGLLAFAVYDASSWQWYHYALWTVAIVGALELLAYLVMAGGHAAGMGKSGKSIPDSSPPLQELEFVDRAFIFGNKLLTAMFTYHVLRYAWVSGLIVWDLRQISLLNTVLVLPALYVVYDLGYYWFHRILHIKSLYPLVHKHHHRQHSPFRGNTDAINVHTFEFVVGEYNHLATIHLVAKALTAVAAALPVGGFAHSLLCTTVSGSTTGGTGIHLAAVLVFIVLGGVLASLNHTRFDVRAPLFENLFQVRFHDIHHARDVMSNYSQYTMLWDCVFGSFKQYEERPSKRSKVATDAAAAKDE